MTDLGSTTIIGKSRAVVSLVFLEIQSNQVTMPALSK